MPFYLAGISYLITIKIKFLKPMTKDIFNYSKNKQLHLINLAEFFSHLGAGLLTPIYSILTEKLGGDAVDSGWTYALYLFVQPVAISIFAYFPWIIGNRKKMIIASYLMQLLASLLFLFVYNIPTLAILQIFLAIQSSLYATVFHSYYGTYAVKSEIDDSRVWSLWNISTYLGGAIASLVGGILVSTLGFMYIFAFMISMSAIAVFLAYKFEPEK